VNARAGIWLSLTAVLGGALGCEEPSQDHPIPIGLLLAYTGTLAANSVNSERALLLAIERANHAGGVDGRRVQVVARDTHSDPRKVARSATELLDANIAVLIGPDNTDAAQALRLAIDPRTLILPSLATASDVGWKPPNWFVMGAGLGQFACELVTQAKAEGASNPLTVVSPSAYNSSLSFELLNSHGTPKYTVASDVMTSGTAIESLIQVLRTAPTYILAAAPTDASRLIYALTAVGALGDPTRWYLSPTLHTPVFLESIPRGVLNGARGVAPGTVAGAADFRTEFQARWQDTPLDDAYPFYDAGAIAVLALQRALSRTGIMPSPLGVEMAEHIIAVTRAGGESVKWNELDRGLQLLRDGREIAYFGVTGQLQFDALGLAQNASTKWWSISPEGFTDLPNSAECR
jgi:ABC-type branched-subunit amino acid transport system substrate-binding protein